MRINNGDFRNILSNRTDSTTKIEKEIAKYPMLSESEEKCFLREYKTSKDISARDRIVYGNLRFVYSAARAYSKDPDMVQDLYIEGLMGILDAIEAFDINRDIKFMSYANEWVRKRMSMYVDSLKKISRWSERKYSSKVTVEKDAFFQKNGRYPTGEELLDIIKEKYNCTDIKDASMLEKLTFKSINDVSVNDEEQTFENSEDFCSHTASENDYMKEVEIEAMREKINKALCILGEREREIMKMLYGIGTPDGEPMSAESIGDYFGIGAARINQINLECLKKLRKYKKLVA